MTLGRERHTPVWDYIIVGGGTAGCLIAARLAEDADTRVLLLEAGPRYPVVPLGVPLVGLRFKEHYAWNYMSQPQPGLLMRSVPFPFGRVLGGSSSVNAMMYVRGDAQCYDRWAALGNPGWAFADLLPYFRRAEHQERGPSAHHGTGGPIPVSDPVHVAPFSRAFVDACREIGLPTTDDFNGPRPDGAGLFQLMQSSGHRATTASLVAGRRGRVAVATGASVERIVFENARAVAVEYTSRDGRRHVARTSREVIVSAGAFNSPKLLMLSGVGSAGRLRTLGIPVVVDLPGVGANLQDHVRIPVLYRSGQRSPASPRHWLRAVLEYGARRRGVLASNCCEAGARIRSRADANCVDLQIVTHFQSAAGRDAVDLEVCLFQTASRGTVTIASRDPAAPPSIDPQYLAADADMRLAIDGVRLARRLAAASALRRFPLTDELAPGPRAATARELEHYIRSAATTSFHPAGSCRMGNDAGAVVNAQLQVRGVERLRVIDASVMPELPNGHTAAPTLMIAERGADLLRGRGAPAEVRV
ncbi:MAG: GMC family oxidoreductase [Vicinamibacterales bacterium]